MKKTEINEFDIRLNKDELLRAASCQGAGPVYERAARYFDEINAEMKPLLGLYAAAAWEDGRIYCLVTAGEAVSAYISGLFAAGEAMKGLLADTAADSYIFEADKMLSERIKRECAMGGFGIKNRLDAPKDFPLSEQSVIIEKTASHRVTLTDAFMLNPVKSLAYILELTDDKSVFNAQHDCSRCSAPDCPRRSAPDKGSFEIVSDYAFSPKTAAGQSAVCIDIGTTTVAFELLTENGAVSSFKMINPQRRFGHDVLSRIDAANRGRENELSAAIQYALLKGYQNVTASHGSPDKIVIAGNTTMVHLLMNYPCKTLGEYPFISNHLNTIKTTFDSVTSNDSVFAETTVLGGISAFVGGDIVSGLYMCGFDGTDKINLFIDLGTNGEMAVGNRDKIIATSTAAGPAFEGGLISCGTGSVDGAVCGVSLEPFEIKTIGNKPPSGICGTGIIELVSEMKAHGIIDETGLLRGEYFRSGFKLTDGIVFQQEDVRQVQMAKAAVRAGIECLLNEYGASYDDIDKVYLAGGFGYGLSVRKACSIGILPKALEHKTIAVGNSSLGGCARFCTSTDGGESIERIRSVSSEFPLGQHEDFEEMYIKFMNFGKDD